MINLSNIDLSKATLAILNDEEMGMLQLLVSDRISEYKFKIRQTADRIDEYNHEPVKSNRTEKRQVELIESHNRQKGIMQKYSDLYIYLTEGKRKGQVCK